MPKGLANFSTSNHTMPKVKKKTIIIDEEEEITFHGTINPEEAKIHTIELEKSMDIIEEGIKIGSTTGLLEAAIKKIKATLERSPLTWKPPM